MLSKSQIQGFIADGFVRVDEAFSPEVAAACRTVLWRETGCNPDEPSSWTRPVIMLGGLSDAPFVEAANTGRLHRAFDQIVGRGRWVPRDSLGSFPIRFPSDEDSKDTGWHVDASFPGRDPSDFWNYRVNLVSRGRALLMLFLFSDVGMDDAPTRIRVGSHRDVARLLAPAGAEGLTFMQIAEGLKPTETLPEAYATGPAGTVYLCHPFLAHAAQRLTRRAVGPRFMGQPPLYPKGDLVLDRPDGDYSPVEIAIRQALAKA